jgi:glutamate 5-kinase
MNQLNRCHPWAIVFFSFPLLNFSFYLVLYRPMSRVKNIFDSCNKIVIKIGTNLLADKEKGINLERIENIVRNVSHIQSLGKHVVIVSSGAIGAGVAALNLKKRPKSIPEKQAAAAIGQPLLMEAYENAFRKERCNIAQVLLTKDDFISRPRYLNARNTFSVLFS